MPTIPSLHILHISNETLHQKINAIVRDSFVFCKKYFFYVILFFLVSISVSEFARIITFFTQTYIVDTSHINIGEGHTNLIKISPTLGSKGLLSALSDSNKHPNQSKTILFEDGHPLQFGHAQHSDIQLKGLGRYSHWNNSILFSTSDNSNPRTNGRTYSAIFAYTLTGWQIALISLLMTGSFILILPKIRRSFFFQTLLEIFENITATRSFWVLLGSCLFLLPLLNAWLLFPIKPTTDILYGALGGYIPWSDAAGYYEGTREFIETGKLTSFGSRRPLNAVLFAVRLWLVNHDFGSALVLQALMCGISVGLLGSIINKSFGKMAAFTMLIPLFAFGICYVPTTLSETLGLTIGCLAFVLLWQGILERNTFYTLFGCFTLTLGLNARAGAFIILPLLILWLGKEFRDSAKPYSWRMLVLGGGSIFLGFLFNSLLGKLFGHSDGQAYANFAYLLYGLSVGGDWTYVYKAFPKLAATLSEKEFSSFLYQQSIKTILQNPEQLISSLIKNLFLAIKYLLLYFNSVFSIIMNSVNFLSQNFKNILGVMFFTPLFLFYIIFRFTRAFKNHHAGFQFIFIGILGNLLSASFIWLDGGIRSFATTLPFYAVFIGVLFSLLTNSKLMHPISNRGLQSSRRDAKLALGFCGTILIASYFGPYLFRITYPKNITEVSYDAFDSKRPNLLIRNIFKSPTVTIIPDNNIELQPNVFKHRVSAKTFLENTPHWSENYIFFKKLLDPNKFSKPITVSLVYDVNMHRNIYVIGESSIFAMRSKDTALSIFKHSSIRDADGKNVSDNTYNRFLDFYYIQPK